MADENYYINNYLQITAEVQRGNTVVDLSTASVLRIYYKKPVSKTVGYWSGTLSGSHQIVYNATKTGDNFDLNEAGVWLLKAYASWSDGTVYQGDVCELEIKNTWEIP